MWKPNFCDARLTPGLESVDPCGPLGHLSGDLSSQVREKGHLDTGAGINVQSCQKTKGNISKGGFLLLQTFRINHSTPHATLFCKWSSWSPITEVLKRGFAGRGQTRSHTCPISKTSASSDFQKTVQSSWDRSLQINKSLYDIPYKSELCSQLIYIVSNLKHLLSSDFPKTVQSWDKS